MSHIVNRQLDAITPKLLSFSQFQTVKTEKISDTAAHREVSNKLTVEQIISYKSQTAK
jgi:predicted lactoylglutathione lyase